MSEFTYRVKTNVQEATGSIEAENKEDAEAKLTELYTAHPEGVKSKKKLKILELEIGGE